MHHGGWLVLVGCLPASNSYYATVHRWIIYVFYVCCVAMKLGAIYPSVGAVVLAAESVFSS